MNLSRYGIRIPVCWYWASFPSVKSRQQKFYYGHPQNRFWKVTAALLERGVPERIEEKKKLLLEGHIAVWDVIDSCDIEGSSDSSIRNVKANDIGRPFGKDFHTGRVCQWG